MCQQPIFNVLSTQLFVVFYTKKHPKKKATNKIY